MCLLPVKCIHYQHRPKPNKPSTDCDHDKKTNDHRHFFVVLAHCALLSSAQTAPFSIASIAPSNKSRFCIIGSVRYGEDIAVHARNSYLRFGPVPVSWAARSPAWRPFFLPGIRPLRSRFGSRLSGVVPDRVIGVGGVKEEYGRSPPLSALLAERRTLFSNRLWYNKNRPEQCGYIAQA